MEHTLDLTKVGVIDNTKVDLLNRELIPDLFVEGSDCKSVYHYTSIGGVEGVLKGTLRFTDIRYMNDREEVIAGLLEFRKSYMRSESDEFIRLREREIQKNMNLRTFVCCFSLDRDSLAMWNYYTKDINNKGYNIGFDYKDLIIGIMKKNSELDGCKLMFGKLDYINKEETYAQLTEKQLRNNLIAGLEGLVKACNSLAGKETSEPLPREDLSELVVWKYCGESNRFNKVIGSDAAYFMKRPCFSIESEFRIVIQIPDDVLEKIKNTTDGNIKYKFRQSGGILIPYLEIEYDKDSLTGMMFSPTVNDELAEQSIKDYCRYCDIDPEKLPEGIEKSTIPVRY